MPHLCKTARILLIVKKPRRLIVLARVELCCAASSTNQALPGLLMLHVGSQCCFQCGRFYQRLASHALLLWLIFLSATMLLLWRAAVFPHCYCVKIDSRYVSRSFCYMKSRVYESKCCAETLTIVPQTSLRWLSFLGHRQVALDLPALGTLDTSWHISYLQEFVISAVADFDVLNQSALRGGGCPWATNR